MIEQKIKLQKKKIIIEIILEYLFVLFMIFLFPHILSNMGDAMIGDNTGLDNIGQASVVGFLLRIFKYAIVLGVGLIYPIVMLITFLKGLYKKSISKLKTTLYVVLIIIPILISILSLFEIPISNFLFDMKYNSSTSAYTVKKENYKTTKDFYNELKKRDLLYSDETKELEDKLNYGHGCENYDGNIGGKCYRKSTMFGIDDKTFFDEPSEENIVNKDVKYPYYIYNAILTLPEENGDLEYAALGRYSYNNMTRYGEYDPYFNDFYIECKILYVDGQIYALIGIDESYSIDKYYNETSIEEYESKGNYSSYDVYTKPYYMILSEKDTITTYVNEKYHSNGKISISSNSFEMAPNTNGVFLYNSYFIKKVDRLDKATINKMAKKLQEDILKEPIKYHYDKKKLKQIN